MEWLFFLAEMYFILGWINYFFSLTLHKNRYCFKIIFGCCKHPNHKHVFPTPFHTYRRTENILAILPMARILFLMTSLRAAAALAETNQKNRLKFHKQGTESKYSTQQKDSILSERINILRLQILKSLNYPHCQQK